MVLNAYPVFGCRPVPFLARSKHGVLPAESKKFSGDLKPDPREQFGATAYSANRRAIMKMYVGNLSFKSTKQDITELFSEHGEVTDVHLPVDRDSGQPRGFAFVTMSSASEMTNAIAALDGKELDGRNLKVNEAQAREERGGGGGGGGGNRRY